MQYEKEQNKYLIINRKCVRVKLVSTYIYQGFKNKGDNWSLHYLNIDDQKISKNEKSKCRKLYFPIIRIVKSL